MKIRKSPVLHPDTALARGMLELFKQLGELLPTTRSIDAYVAGGLGAYLYTTARPTADVDAEFSARILIPTDLMVDVVLESGERQPLYFNTGYNPRLSLLHADYRSDAIPLDISGSPIHIRVLSPVDLAVSNVTRFEDHDRADIQALVRQGLVAADELERRAQEAIEGGGYICAMETVRGNIRDAVVLARKVQAERRS